MKLYEIFRDSETGDVVRRRIVAILCSSTVPWKRYSGDRNRTSNHNKRSNGMSSTRNIKKSPFLILFFEFWVVAKRRRRLEFSQRIALDCPDVPWRPNEERNRRFSTNCENFENFCIFFFKVIPARKKIAIPEYHVYFDLWSTFHCRLPQDEEKSSLPQ